MAKSFKTNYLHFTKKERTGTLVLLFLIAVLALIPMFYRWIFPRHLIPRNELLPAINLFDSVAQSAAYGKDGYRSNLYPKRAYHQNEQYEKKIPSNSVLFNFDPNTLDIEGWLRLGIKEKTAIGIQHYISKGGKFREATDIKKIWGISPVLQEKLIPFVKIQKNESSPVYARNEYVPTANKVSDARSLDLDINNSDSAAYIALPGIGYKLAARIINFRNRLGGFYSPEQIGETFGLPDSTFQRIKPYLKQSTSPVKKINLNLATEDEFKLHPYIRWQLAKVIVQYRSQHGNFAAPEDLRKIMIITDEIYKKLSPYLAVNE